MHIQHFRRHQVAELVECSCYLVPYSAPNRGKGRQDYFYARLILLLVLVLVLMPLLLMRAPVQGGIVVGQVWGIIYHVQRSIVITHVGVCRTLELVRVVQTSIVRTVPFVLICS